MSARSLVLLRSAPDTLRERIAEFAGDRRSLRAAVITAACVHAGLASLFPTSSTPRRPLTSRIFTPAELVVERPAPKAPPAAPREAPKPALRPEPRSSRPQPSTAEPEAARAGAVLTQAEPSDAPLDLTDTVVTGVGATDPGGATSARGTSERFSRAVRLAHANHAEPAPSAANAGDGDGPDRTQGPSVVGGLAWDCPFPAEADVAGVNRAQVALSVEVDGQGRPSRVIPLSDPGYGFAQAARSCALRKHWLPGTDRTGRPTTAGITLNVRFVR